jgi:hypothetical protein
MKLIKTQSRQEFAAEDRLYGVHHMGAHRLYAKIFSIYSLSRHFLINISISYCVQYEHNEKGPDGGKGDMAGERRKVRQI